MCTVWCHDWTARWTKHLPDMRSFNYSLVIIHMFMASSQNLERSMEKGNLPTSAIDIPPSDFAAEGYAFSRLYKFSSEYFRLPTEEMQCYYYSKNGWLTVTPRA